MNHARRNRAQEEAAQENLLGQARAEFEIGGKILAQQAAICVRLFRRVRLLRQKRLGILTIGGGVPRNWSQQFGPFIELRHRRMGENLPLKRYHYGVRICPEPVYWGGLSGSPYSEAISWGKFVPPAEGGKFGEVFVDATVGLPLIVAAVLERLRKDKNLPRATKEKALAGKR